MEVSIALSIAWAALLVIAIFIYVVLDGFDLGIGILFGLVPERKNRDVMMNSVAPVWDGNETWLVLGGGGLFAAFPLAYAILMPALYAPVIAMLLALVFRGVAFEFRWRTERWLKWWDRAFIIGSTMAAFSQGVILGAILQGVAVDGRAYGGGWWDWLSLFSFLTGIAVVAGYALLGATWLVMKTEGPLQEKARKLAWAFGLATVAFIVLVSLFTPYLEAAYYQRWLSMPGIFFAAPVPIAVAVITLLMFRSLTIHNHEYRPFILALVLFALCFAGLGISMYPYIIPTEVTIFEAAAPFNSQIFMFVGAVILIPIILAYTAYAYWVFRGKIDPEEGYH
ncbi:cytochrome d ubiquinol oxidase subunit II [Aquisalinus flavus]|uniref:Ubiquinol oxidase subunit II, cyanide insensitive n=1 Tax=Aquisalinus flavus TaxID=1526572 RepID=A0A8J2Y449_9PROT|nr:cytochrome d ubiquinol oxidase subunit II [Aquisalinus flavus]MBD0425631.1 cytochrome d ubiquinol oxidase subunit II [Aquisalinus flavus]UNE48752.1 cytochrome d ubiquinol oxidase subunit II [Aquisalinus flavus]GGD14490.1 ubiquinol oxidase subunit II, cyanide insensitive [Aquisalinus flavus]